MVIVSNCVLILGIVILYLVGLGLFFSPLWESYDAWVMKAFIQSHFVFAFPGVLGYHHPRTNNYCYFPSLRVLSLCRLWKCELKPSWDAEFKLFILLYWWAVFLAGPFTQGVVLLNWWISLNLSSILLFIEIRVFPPFRNMGIKIQFPLLWGSQSPLLPLLPF